jgi:hypothetical protein
MPAGPPPTIQQRVVTVRGDIGCWGMTVSIFVPIRDFPSFLSVIFPHFRKNIKLFRPFRTATIDI